MTYFRFNMSRFTIFLLACSAVFTVTIGKSLKEQKQINTPKPIHGADEQCKDRNYFGACLDWLPENGYQPNPDTCVRLICAQRMLIRPYLIKAYTGRPLDGTICGKSKICRNGTCVEVNRDEIPKNEGKKRGWSCFNLTDISAEYLPDNRYLYQTQSKNQDNVEIVEMVPLKRP